MAYYVVLPFGLIMSFVFCVLRRTGFSLRNLILKSISSLCYLLTAVFALVSNPDAYIYGSLIIFGGALGLVGDILLDLKGIYKNDESTYLMGGFIFFLVGHLFYSGAIIFQTRMKWWIVLLCLLGGVLLSIGNSFVSKLMKIHFGAYRKIVFTYVIFLSTTMILSIVSFFTLGFHKNFLLLSIGAVCFTASDAVLSSTFFARG